MGYVVAGHGRGLGAVEATTLLTAVTYSPLLVLLSMRSPLVRVGMAIALGAV